MMRNWTVGQRLGVGFIVVIALSTLLGAVSLNSLRAVIDSTDEFITKNAPRIRHAERLRGEREAKSAAARGFLLTRGPEFVSELDRLRVDFLETMNRLQELGGSPETRRLLAAVAQAEDEYHNAVRAVIALRATEDNTETVARVFAEKVIPKRDTLEARIDAFIRHEESVVADARNAASEAAATSRTVVLWLTIAIVAASALLAVVLTRTVATQIGSAVSLVQSSSSELQAAASQQASGAKEHATAMSEITTTISELLATSRQIAESARRVADIADQTAVAARAGETTVSNGHGAMEGIRRQVEMIVTNMMDLGKKSQHIGAVLEIVAELAEQTNILAINATIEAAGAGEAGKRFAVVADEIRKLADRVTGSTKEIRTLVDDIRSAVNTTVMTTETGSKAVDAGTKQFSEVATAFKQIATLVRTTTDAAREIELSTKQQSTAVEQVNIAIANVAQASRETEASSNQTLQTASELSGLSRMLMRMVQSSSA